MIEIFWEDVQLFGVVLLCAAAGAMMGAIGMGWFPGFFHAPLWMAGLLMMVLGSTLFVFAEWMGSGS